MENMQHICIDVAPTSSPACVALYSSTLRPNSVQICVMQLAESDRKCVTAWSPRKRSFPRKETIPAECGRDISFNTKRGISVFCCKVAGTMFWLPKSIPHTTGTETSIGAEDGDLSFSPSAFVAVEEEVVLLSLSSFFPSPSSSDRVGEGSEDAAAGATSGHEGEGFEEAGTAFSSVAVLFVFSAEEDASLRGDADGVTAWGSAIMEQAKRPKWTEAEMNLERMAPITLWKYTFSLYVIRRIDYACIHTITKTI